MATAQCLPLTAEVPLLPIIDLLRSVEEDGGDSLDSALGAAPAFVRASIGRLLPELAAAEPDLQRADDFAQHHLFAALRRTFVDLAATRHVALVLEDVHWADATTLDLLESLLSRPLPVPMVATWRADDTTVASTHRDWFSRLRRSGATQLLELQPLSRTEVAELMRLLTGTVPAKAALESMYEHARGHPLFTEQLTVAGPDRSSLPPLLTDVLERRLRDLTTDEWRVVRVLGVAERLLDPPLLSAASGLEPEAMDGVLGRLRDRWLLAAAPAPDLGAALRHPLLAAAVRQRLAGSEPVAVHGQLAAALSVSDGPPEEVALHWRAAGNAREELLWRVRAAREAGSRFAFADEWGHWTRALELWPDAAHADGVGDSLSRTGTALAAMSALRMAGRFEQAESLGEAVQPWWDEMTSLERAEVLDWKGAFALEFDRPDEALDFLTRSASLYVEAGERVSLVDLCELTAAAHLELGHLDEAETAMDEAEAHLAELDRPDLVFELHASRASFDAVRGDLDASLARIRAARALLEEPSPLAEIFLGMCHTDALMLHQRPAPELEAAGRPSLDAAAEFGLDYNQVWHIRTNMADALLRAGRVREATELIDPITQGEPNLDRWVSHLFRARVDATRGDLARATRVVAVLDEHGVADRLDYAWDAAHVDLAAGRADHALTRLDTVLANDHSPSRALFAAPALALALRAAADLVEQGRHPDPLVVARLQSLVPVTLRDAELARALELARRAELARLEHRAGIDAWSRAARAWDEVGRPHDAAYCRWRAAQVALREGQGTVAARLLKQANRDARDHIPLSQAIAETAAHARA